METPPASLPYSKQTLTIQPLVRDVPTPFEFNTHTGESHQDTLENETEMRQRETFMRFIPAWSLNGMGSITSVRVDTADALTEMIRAKMTVVDRLQAFATDRMSHDVWSKSTRKSAEAKAWYIASQAQVDVKSAGSFPNIDIYVEPITYHPGITDEHSAITAPPSVEILPFRSASEDEDVQVGYNLRSGSGLNWDVLPRFDDDSESDALERWHVEQLTLPELHKRLAKALKTLPGDMNPVSGDALVHLAERVVSDMRMETDYPQEVNFVVRTQNQDPHSDQDEEHPASQQAESIIHETREGTTPVAFRFSAIPVSERLRVANRNYKLTTTADSSSGSRGLPERPNYKTRGRGHLETARRDTYTLGREQLSQADGAPTTISTPAVTSDGDWANMKNVPPHVEGVSWSAIVQHGRLTSATRKGESKLDGKEPNLESQAIKAPSRPDPPVNTPSWATIAQRGDKVSRITPSPVTPQNHADTTDEQSYPGLERDTMVSSSPVSETLIKPKTADWADTLRSNVVSAQDDSLIPIGPTASLSGTEHYSPTQMSPTAEVICDVESDLPEQEEGYPDDVPESWEDEMIETPTALNFAQALKNAPEPNERTAPDITPSSAAGFSVPASVRENTDKARGRGRRGGISTQKRVSSRYTGTSAASASRVEQVSLNDQTSRGRSTTKSRRVLSPVASTPSPLMSNPFQCLSADLTDPGDDKD